MVIKVYNSSSLQISCTMKQFIVASLKLIPTSHFPKALPLLLLLLVYKVTRNPAPLPISWVRVKHIT